MTTRTTGSAHDFLRYGRPSLDCIFKPQAVAVIGATDRAGSIGRTLFWNLISNAFGGTVYPVNPRRRHVLGVRAYPTVADVPESIDLAIIAVPAPKVLDCVEQCADAGVRAAIIISAGFREIGSEGTAREEALLAVARRSGMRLIGPNCLGVMAPRAGLNATFAESMARPGNVAFLSQSAGICASILDWSLRENVGFSAFVGVGSMLDVGWSELIDYLGDDPQTKSIVIYLETLGDVRAFMSAAREVALNKPIIVLKPGRSDAAAQAVASHTGALTDTDAVVGAAFRRCGVLRVHQVADLFFLAEALAKQPRPKGPRLAIVTNAGGPGVLAMDALLSSGGELAELTEATQTALDALLPAHWSRANPVDILGGASAETYAEAGALVAADPGNDGVLVVFAPQSAAGPTAAADAVARIHAAAPGKTVLASWMGGAAAAAGAAVLNAGGIPTFEYPDTAARVFTTMHQYSRNLRSLYETPRLPGEIDPDRAAAARIIDAARAAGRTLLSEIESKQVLAAYNIATVPTFLARSVEAAVTHATAIGYPVVLKLHSHTITHKSAVGGVKLYLDDEAAVRAAYAAIEQAVAAADFQGVTVQSMRDLRGRFEIIIGATLDPTFGPVLLFGTGGTLVEVFGDRALGLPPLNSTLARRMMERTTIYRALQSAHAAGHVDLTALEACVVQFSFLVAEQKWIREIEVNPLLVSAESPTALDARILLHPPDTAEADLPRLAIRPYPVQYEQPWTTKKGLRVNIRPIRPEDEPLLVTFHEGLSEESVYQRFFQSLKLSQRVAHERLTRVAFIDYDREMALVVTYHNPESGQKEIIAAGRLSRSRHRNDGEFAILISDAYQRQGLGTELLRRLIAIGRAEGMDNIIAYMLPTNAGMMAVSERLGFKFRYEDTLLKAELPLTADGDDGGDSAETDG